MKFPVFSTFLVPSDGSQQDQASGLQSGFCGFPSKVVGFFVKQNNVFDFVDYLEFGLASNFTKLLYSTAH